MGSSDYYNSISEGYEELHREEQEKKLELIKQILEVKESDKLLDVGCGTGVTSQFNCDVTGADPAEKLIEKAIKNTADKKKIQKIKKIKIFPRTWVVSPAENLPFKDNEFDVVVSVTAIQNFEDIKKGLKEIRRVGKPESQGGRFVLTFLKKSKNKEEIEQLITNLFHITEKIEEEKDIIFFCTIHYNKA